MHKLSIVIPVYNEAGAIRQVLNLVEAAGTPGVEKEIIVVDDRSTDGTREILGELENENKYKIIYHDENRGKGGALKTGFKAATGDYILIQDADLEYDPEDFKILLEPIKNGSVDMVFGSRFLKKNNVPFSSIYFYGGMLVGKIFNGFFGTSISDVATCYKVFPAHFSKELSRLSSDDFVFDVIELTHFLSQKGDIAEVPITYRARSRSEGKKLNYKHGLRCVSAIIRIKLKQYVG